jgi:membrane-associated phospholipid phosphatase
MRAGEKVDKSVNQCDRVIQMESQKAQPSPQNPPRAAALPAWLDPLIWLVVLIVVACLGFHYDQSVVSAIAGHQIEWLEQVAGIISKFGDWPELMGYATVALIGVGFARKRTLVKVILCMMIAGTLAGALTNSVRLISGRARPNNHEVPPGWYGLEYQGQWLLGEYKFHSFPSGHTATAFAFFGVIGFAYRRRWAWSFLVLASMIAWSRLYINAHFFSDVLVGVVVGLFFAQLTWLNSLRLVQQSR